MQQQQYQRQAVRQHLWNRFLTETPNESLQRGRGVWAQGFRAGMIAVGVELERMSRAYENVRGMTLDDSLALHVASALRATVLSLRIADDVDATISAIYGGDDALQNAWRTAPPRQHAADALLEEDRRSDWGAPDEAPSPTTEEWE